MEKHHLCRQPDKAAFVCGSSRAHLPLGRADPENEHSRHRSRGNKAPTASTTPRRPRRPGRYRRCRYRKHCLKKGRGLGASQEGRLNRVGFPVTELKITQSSQTAGSSGTDGPDHIKVIFPTAAGAGIHTVSLTWRRRPSRREQRLAEVFPPLLRRGFWCCLDQGQVLPALLQGFLLSFGIAFITRAGGSVYQLEGRKTHADKLLSLYRFPNVTP